MPFHRTPPSSIPRRWESSSSQGDANSAPRFTGMTTFYGGDSKGRVFGENSLNLKKLRPLSRSFFSIVASLLWIILLSGSAAYSQSQQGMNFNLEGKITEHSAGKLTVSAEDNIIFHVTYDDNTRIYRKDGSAGSAKDLKTGIRIKVDGELSPAGVVEAHRIDLE
jgi:hypothetical protein